MNYVRFLVCLSAFSYVVYFTDEIIITFQNYVLPRYVGVLFYITFPHVDKTRIPDNFLNFFPPNDVMAVVARAFLLVQMVAVFPLLIYILRIQVRP